MNLKKMLASSCRQKIVIYLSHVEKTNIMKLVRKTNSTYNEVDRNLQILEAEGIVGSHRVRHQRILTLNYANKKTATLLEALTLLDKLTATCDQSNCERPKIET
ncbi:MAG: hypothetical protein ACOWW1_04565 [archaeon]